MATTTLPMRSGNPALSSETFRTLGRVAAGDEAMTIEGTVNKTVLSLLLLVFAASYTWNLGLDDPRVMTFVTVGMLGGLVMAIATIFRKTWAPWPTPAYAVLEGLALGVAALNLVLDFDFIEQGAASGAPKYMEWYGAFGLLVTLIWLYLELLRLLAKLQDRR